MTALKLLLLGVLLLCGLFLGWMAGHQGQLTTHHDAVTNANLNKALWKLGQRQSDIEGDLEKLSAAVERLARATEVQRAAEQAAEEEPAEMVAAEPVTGAASAREEEPKCPDRKPYHTILTATGSTYQQWQSRIMYHHWKKQAAAGGPCSDMVGFTRLCATHDARPDGLEGEIPSIFTKELSGQFLAAHMGFGVLNRPNSVTQLFETHGLLSQIASKYVLILETDHVIMNPIPNKATPTSPMAYVFGYMTAQPSQDYVIKKYWPEGGYAQLQPVGPSPVLIHLDQLRLVYKRWAEISYEMRSNTDAERVIQGWVQEMWGYSIAAASLGIRHQLFNDFQVEPGALSNREQLRDFTTRYWIFHYTYQFEYMLDGTPCQPWNIGEYSLDKRHFNDKFPARPLPLPPASANTAAFWLVSAFNEAMAAGSWPETSTSEAPIQTVYGRRRLDWFSRHANGFAQELRKAPLVRELAGSSISAGSCTTPR